MVETPEPDCWLHPGLEVRASPIEGLGLFASQPIAALPPGSRNGKGNHSCDPNLWWTGTYELTRRRALSPGDEATVDYGTLTDDPSFALPCRCGALACRGTVTGSDWMLPDLGQRYADHWAPVLRDRIRQASSG